MAQGRVGFFGLVVAAVFLLPSTPAVAETHKALLRDIASVEGVRDNSLVGYGLVAGLKGTGDKQQTYFTVQTLASVLARMGVEIPPAVLQSTVQVKNVAAVFVTASLPPFARPGLHVDVMVSSVGDARSLEGGLLLLTPLYASDGQVYAAAQGPLVVGGYTAGSATNSKQVNHPTVGRIPGGALVERDSSLDLAKLTRLSLLLNEPSFSTAEEVAAVINHDFTTELATVVDSRRIEIQVPAAAQTAIPALLARIENLEVEVRRRAKVVVNERTGTVVLGKDVHLGAVSILHGNFSVAVTTSFAVWQPNPPTAGQTEVISQNNPASQPNRQAAGQSEAGPQTNAAAPANRLAASPSELVPQTKLEVSETPARNIQLGEGASVEELVTRLQAIGATARDVISILQAIKDAGALDAELEVI